MIPDPEWVISNQFALFSSDEIIVRVTSLGRQEKGFSARSTHSVRAGQGNGCSRHRLAISRYLLQFKKRSAAISENSRIETKRSY